MDSLEVLFNHKDRVNKCSKEKEKKEMSGIL